MALCRARGVRTGNREYDEKALLEWADYAFCEGAPAYEGTSMLAAYTHFHPQNGRFGQPLAMVARALQAWSKLVPSLGRIPPAYPMVCGIAVCLCVNQRWEMALAVLVALSGYLRPGELHALRGHDLVAPMRYFGEGYRYWSLVLGSRDGPSGPTKAGIYDDAVILDHETLQWMRGALAALKRRRPGGEPLWDFSENEFRIAFSKAAEDSGLGHLHLTPYHLPHAGPSWDALTKCRDQRAIQRRGRWASRTVAQRYERSSRVVHVL